MDSYCPHHGEFTGDYCAECAIFAIETYGDQPLRSDLPSEAAYIYFLRSHGVVFC